MESLAFLHIAANYEDPNPEPELRSLDELKLPISAPVVMGTLAAGVVGATLTHADQAHALMRYGQSGPGVARLQRALGTPADGVYGPQTRNDVLYFQRTSGLAVDGIAGPQTLAALGLPRNLGPGGGTGGDRPVSGYATVTASSGLYIRNSPGGAVVGSVGYGTRVALTGRERSGWCELASGNWVACRYLSTGGGSDVPISGSGGVGTVTTGAGLRVRANPGLGSAVIDSLGYGARVPLADRAPVSRDGYTWIKRAEFAGGGWVAAEYIR